MTLGRNSRKRLESRFKGLIRYDEPMRKHTSFRIGGPADVFATPRDLQEIYELICWARENRLPCFIIGDGTNLLVHDSGIRGIIITMTKGMKKISVEDKKSDFSVATAMAGAKTSSLCRFAMDHNLKGMNWALGIPGTVGGGIMMNAGTSFGSVEKNLISVDILTPDGHTKKIERNKMNFSYRQLYMNISTDSILPDSPIITSGSFRLFPEDPDMLKKEAREILDNRKSRQPLSAPSAGCFFKNPPDGKTAGELIDLAGLKGERVGDAMISNKHANFIVNKNRAAASDVLKLMEIAREKVFKKFNVELEPEVKIIG